MRPVHAAARLQEPALRRLAHVSHTLKMMRRAGPKNREERKVAYAVIELQNTWSEFSRALFLTYALRGVSPSGVRVTHGIARVASKADALAEARSYFNGMRPTWHQATTLTGLAQYFGFSNVAEITAGVSVQTRLFSDLPCLRNFYAHKSHQTKRSACSLAWHYRVPVPSHPTEFVVAVAAGRTQSIGEDWVSDIREMVTALTSIGASLSTGS